MSSDPIVILSARRTPVGAFQGVFAGVTAPQLGSVAIKAALADSGVPAGDVDEVIMGCVLSAGLGQAPARQAALGAGIPAGVPATTVNKMCGSAMRAVMLASDQILAGSARVIVAGGLESISLVQDGREPFCRSDVQPLRIHATGTGRLRARIGAPGASGGGRRRLRERGCAGNHQDAQGRGNRRQGRDPRVH